MNSGQDILILIHRVYEAMSAVVKTRDVDGRTASAYQPKRKAIASKRDVLRVLWLVVRSGSWISS